MDGIKIMRPSLDDEDRDTVLRGLIDLSSLGKLRVDHYQRERLGRLSNRQIQRAIDMNTRLPDITLGMRGDRFHVDDSDGGVVLLDPVFIIDGQQRVETIKAHLARFPNEPIKLGATIHFGTTERTERLRFEALNLYGTRVGAGVILRNARTDCPLLAALYGLTQTDKSFALHKRVAWNQTKSPDQLLSAATYIQVSRWIHSHLAPGKKDATVAVVQSLDLLTRRAGIQQVRQNVHAFFDLLDDAWGVRSLQGKASVPYMKSGFLRTMAEILSDHQNYWEGNKLVVAPDARRRFATFKVHSPDVANLAASMGAQPRSALRFMLLEHLNSRVRKKLIPRRPVELADDDIAAE